MWLSLGFGQKHNLFSQSLSGRRICFWGQEGGGGGGRNKFLSMYTDMKLGSCLRAVLSVTCWAGPTAQNSRSSCSSCREVVLGSWARRHCPHIKVKVETGEPGWTCGCVASSRGSGPCKVSDLPVMRAP